MLVLCVIQVLGTPIGADPRSTMPGCKKRTLSPTLDLPLFGNLGVGSWSSTPGEGLGFEQAPCVLVRLDEGKQAKACVILPGLGLSPAQLHWSQITPHCSWQSQLGWKNLVILTRPQEPEDLLSSSLLCFENFLRKHFRSVGDFTSWEKSSCWCFTAQISLRSVKSQLDTTMIDFIDFPLPPHPAGS